MKLRLSILCAAMAGLLSAPADAMQPDCHSKYREFLETAVPYFDQFDRNELPILMRRGLSVFDACMAGDTFTLHGYWDQIKAELEDKHRRKP